MSKKIFIVAGDPNSINTEIIFKSWIKLDDRVKKKIFLIASHDLILKQFKKLKLKISLIKINHLSNQIDSNKLKIIDVPLKFNDPFNISENYSSTYVKRCLNLAHNLSIKNKKNFIINCPIDKKLLSKSKKIGVTEFLATKCKIYTDSEIMMIYNPKFSIVPLTTHLSLKEVSKNITQKKILRKILSLNKSYKKLFKKKPKIGVLGLNPHNGELRSNSEEVLHIIPAIKKLKKKGLNIKGPLVSDTIFVENYKKYNVIVGMYHDQVLSPFKTLFHFDAINITLGLNYIRVSPDHGTAVDLIGKNKANYLSLMKCIEFIYKI